MIIRIVCAYYESKTNPEKTSLNKEERTWYKIEMGYQQRYPNDPHNEKHKLLHGYFPPEALESITRMKALIREVKPKDSGEIYEIASPMQFTPEDYQTADYCFCCCFRDEESDAEITHHTDSVLTCPACGNERQNPFFVPAIRPEKLHSKPIFMGFYGTLKLFCRPEFIKRYEKSGLTGLDFVDWGEKDKLGKPLTLIHARQHRWQDRQGVCDACEMKTNLTGYWGMFNSEEEFKYDIQYVSTYDGETFILSRRAVAFFYEISSFMKMIIDEYEGEDSLLVPILPGFQKELIWPEPRLCTPDKPPLYMLRSSWEK